MPEDFTSRRFIPLTLDFTDRALAKAKETTAWLKTLPFDGEAAAARFSETLDRELAELCADIAERLATASNLPRPDLDASIAFSMLTYKHTFTTGAGGKRRRRQTSGVYVLLYALPGDGTLQLLTVRHASAEPLTAFLDPQNENAAHE